MSSHYTLLDTDVVKVVNDVVNDFLCTFCPYFSTHFTHICMPFDIIWLSFYPHS
jgi:hypothetical protein